VPDSRQLASYYPSGYWAGPPATDAAAVRQRLTERYRRAMLRDHLRFVRHAIDAQRRLGKARVELLDVGCGDGLFLQALGHEPCEGLDFSAGAVAACRARGIQAGCGALEANPFGGRQFDLVTMFHFLEHVSPAAPTLEHIKRLLGPSGEIVLQVPNAASVQAHVLGRYWAGYDVPRHLITYTTQTLRSVLGRHGFEVIQISHWSIRDNPTTLANSLTPWLYPPARVSRGLARGRWRAWTADLAYLFLSTALLPVTLLESAIGLGAAVMVRARPTR